MEDHRYTGKPAQARDDDLPCRNGDGLVIRVPDGQSCPQKGCVVFEAIDHLVVVVNDLDEAVKAYGALGFTVVRGGRHNIGTHNALIAFADGSYIELIAFLTPVPSHPWYRALEHGGGLVDFCVRSNDLDADVAALRRAGVAIGDPVAMSRERPDGYLLKWWLSIPSPPFNGAIPFLIRDQTPRDERVPSERTHSNGGCGIERLTIAVRDAERAASWYATVLARKGERVERDDLDATGIHLVIGAHRIELLVPRSSSSVLVLPPSAREAIPYEAVLTGTARTAVTLDRELAQSARLTISAHPAPR